jgi:16S rRNA (cytidine1402-2'-O)-methyltransferase
MKGTLYLIPTPIDETSPLEQSAFELLNKAATEEKESSVFIIEDLKPGRRRWLRFKLPRDLVESFVLCNEHTAKVVSKEILAELKKGKNAYIMSDGGLPAFCDPGRELVDLCHKSNIKVTATPFANSISLALALSGYNHNKFVFEGFLPVEKEKRSKELLNLKNEKRTLILMDTPYRMKRLLEELQEVFGKKREIFLALDLNAESEELLRGSASHLLKSISNYKREFILILQPEI